MKLFSVADVVFNRGQILYDFYSYWSVKLATDVEIQVDEYLRMEVEFRTAEDAIEDAIMDLITDDLYETEQR